MSRAVPHFSLKNGQTIPAVGLGTHWLREPQKMVEIAIDNGYRLLDGAWMYQTEPAIGKAIQNKIQAGVVKREDLFVISKLWRTMHEPKDVLQAMERTLRDLGLRYVDAYLMHFPLASKKAADEYEIINLEEANIPIEVTWKAMEKLVKLGFTKSVGLSNFNIQQTNRIIQNCDYFPVINEIEVNPYFSHRPLLAHCKSNGIQVVAYAPFNSPENPLLDPNIPSLITRPTIVKIAKKHGKTPGQIIVRYLYQIDCVPIPRTNFIEHLKENISIFHDWNGLDEADMIEIAKLNTGKRRFNIDKSKHFKEYPFNENS